MRLRNPAERKLRHPQRPIELAPRDVRAHRRRAAAWARASHHRRHCHPRQIGSGGELLRRGLDGVVVAAPTSAPRRQDRLRRIHCIIDQMCLLSAVNNSGNPPGTSVVFVGSRSTAGDRPWGRGRPLRSKKPARSCGACGGLWKEAWDKFGSSEVDVYFAQHKALLLDPTLIFFRFARKDEPMSILSVLNSAHKIAGSLVGSSLRSWTCDVSVRVQAAHAVGRLQKLAALFPW